MTSTPLLRPQIAAAEKLLKGALEVFIYKVEAIVENPLHFRADTAIAILFAIIDMRPMPFCVLDEIEAALDEANVARYAKYLKKFAQDTQFIVITHRKPTMENADILKGRRSRCNRAAIPLCLRRKAL